MTNLIVVKYYSVIGGGSRHRDFNSGASLFSERRGWQAWTL